MIPAMPRRPARHFATLALIVLPFACGPKSRRDPETPARELSYDDACGLQSYFDERRDAQLPSPKAADETVATDEKGVTHGYGSYVLADPMARRRFGQMLHDEYKGIDDAVVKAVVSGDGGVQVRVKWWDAGATRRLRREQEIVVVTAAGETELPPNPCIADLLFGQKIYDMRARYLRGEIERAKGDEGLAVAPSSGASTAATSAPASPSASSSASASIAP
jgi:hypothetical protein